MSVCEFCLSDVQSLPAGAVKGIDEALHDLRNAVKSLNKAFKLFNQALNALIRPFRLKCLNKCLMLFKDL